MRHRELLSFSTLVALVVLAAPGCAPRPRPKVVFRPAGTAAPVNEGDQLVCTTERQLGSNIVQQRCWRKADLEEAERITQQLLHQPTPSVVKGN